MASKFDVLVLGSGPLGVTVARRLAENGKSVLILEEGPTISEPPGSHLRNSPRFWNNPDSYLAVANSHLAHFDITASRDHLPGAAVTKANGGQGIIWTNLCPRGDALWDALTPSQWDKYYGIAEEYLGVQSKEFESSVRQQRIRTKLVDYLSKSGRSISTLPLAAQFDSSDILHFNAPYDILSGSTNATERVEIVQASVDKLIGHGSRITGVAVGNEMIEGEEIVVAAGAIGTPQLLHRSGIRPEALGHWLSYHPIMITQLVLDQSLCADIGDTDRVPRLQIPPTDNAEWFTVVLRDVSPFEPTAPDIVIDPNRLVEMQFICPVDVNEDNGIRFDDQSQPTFYVPLSTDDESRLTGAEADADQITRVLGRYRSGCRPIWLEFGFAHMMGTTRMGETEDGKSVTDYNGRVWGFDNLRLATNGLIPTRMAVNPTLTGVALAISIADGILNESA